MELRNKKILVVTTTDNMIWQFLIPHIQKMEQEGNKVDCVCAKTGFFFDELKNKYGLNMINIDFSRFPFTPKNIKGYKMLSNIVSKNNYDLVFCHQPVGGVFGRKVAKKFKIPVVYVAHGFHFFKGAPLKNKIYKPIERHYSKGIDALVTMNEEDYIAGNKFKAKNVFKINGIGVDLSKYETDANLSEVQFRKSLGIKEDDFVVLSIGELNVNKNTLCVVKSIKILKDKFLEKNKKFNIKYLICGVGPLQQDFENLIAQNGLEENIKMLGFIKEITKIIQISNLFVMPSLREGLPKTMMEVMVQGLPIVASNIRGCKDLVGNNEGGILCNPKDENEFAEAIFKIYSDKHLSEKFSNRNKTEIQKYSLDTVLNQFDNIWKKI